MKTLTILEVGGLEGLVAMIIGIIILVALFISFIITTFVKLIYESKDGESFQKTVLANNAHLPASLWFGKWSNLWGGL
jgi:hypothetical protein